MKICIDSNSVSYSLDPVLINYLRNNQFSIYPCSIEKSDFIKNNFDIIITQNEELIEKLRENNEYMTMKVIEKVSGEILKFFKDNINSNYELTGAYRLKRVCKLIKK